MLTTLGASFGEIWRDPTIFRINKEKAHAEFLICPSRTEALQPLNLATPWNTSAYESLNGMWDFEWYPNVPAVPSNWNQPNAPTTDWKTIPVPGTWQGSGFDRLYYLNTTMPFQYNWDTGKLRPEFTEEQVDRSIDLGWIPDDAQTIGCYRKWIAIPEERLQQRVVLRIGSVEAGVSVFVNGSDVGYSQDSYTPAEFDISKYLKPGKNLIALMVYRWTDGSYMEIQDMVRFAGIYRDVFLRYEPRQRIQDLYFVGTPEPDLKTIPAIFQVSVANDSKTALTGARIQFELLPEGSDQPVKTWNQALKPVAGGATVSVDGTVELSQLKLWSPDVPQLYTLLASLVDAQDRVVQVVRIDTGFKRFESINGNFHLNGQRFFITGVNRHEHHPKYGRHVPVENMVQDLKRMKQANINTVRTSHYPNDERWYYLCNRYGMALIDEANVESHALETVPGNRPQWLAQAVDRVENLVQRDKNHPSVFIWSLGNEQGHGWNKAFDAQYDRAKELDPTRLVMCDRGNNAKKGADPVRMDKPDTVTPMYYALEKMDKYLENRNKDPRPFFMCEYRHAMGNAVGALKEVWDVVYANENNGLNGGCIWDWIDQGVEAKTADGTVYYQYGGDWGDKKTAGNFCMNGLLLADQSITPKWIEVKKCYEPIQVTALSLDEGRVQVLNRFNQLNLDSIRLSWQVIEDGHPVQSGTVDPIAAAPGERTEVTIPYQRKKLNPNREAYLRIGFALPSDCLWATAGHEVTFAQFYLQGTYHPALASAEGKSPEVTKKNGIVSVKTDAGVELSFDGKSGMVATLRINGHNLLTATTRDRLFDHTLAWIDNYKRKSMPEEFYEMDLEQLKRQGDAEITFSTEESRAVVSIKNTFISKKGAGFEERQTWTMDSRGQIEVVESVSPNEVLGSEAWIPRIGLRIPLHPSLQQVSYYGLGPHENYPDRKFGAWTGIHASTVMENYVPYGKPQDHGNREAVRWMTVKNDDVGLTILAPEPLSMSALPYSQDELQTAKHTIDLPKTPSTTELRIAAKVSGVGNGSCGPMIDEQYRARSAAVTYRFYLIPTTGKTASDGTK